MYNSDKKEVCQPLWKTQKIPWVEKTILIQAYVGATVARLAQHHRLTFHISQNDFSSSHSPVLPLPCSQSWLLIKLLLNTNVYDVYMMTRAFSRGGLLIIVASTTKYSE